MTSKRGGLHRGKPKIEKRPVWINGCRTGGGFKEKTRLNVAWFGAGAKGRGPMGEKNRNRPPQSPALHEKRVTKKTISIGGPGKGRKVTPERETGKRVGGKGGCRELLYRVEKKKRGTVFQEERGRGGGGKSGGFKSNWCGGKVGMGVCHRGEVEQSLSSLLDVEARKTQGKTSPVVVRNGTQQKRGRGCFFRGFAREDGPWCYQKGLWKKGGVGDRPKGQTSTSWGSPVGKKGQFSKKNERSKILEKGDEL